MKFDLIIRNGSVVHADGVRSEGIAVEGGKIAEIAPEIAGDAKEMIDATGLHVFPGLIDSHVHFNEPGRTDWEGFETGSSALAAGGGTCFFDMPLNSSPPVLDSEAFDRKREAAERSSVTDFGLWGGLTPGNLDRMEELAERGVVGFKAFMCNSGIDEFPRADDLTLYEGMQKAAKLRVPVAVHAESEEITRGLTARALAAGKSAMQDYLATRPVDAEVEAVSRAITLATRTGCSLHLVHLSSVEAVLEVVRASRLIDVTCETCPHYLLLNDEDAVKLGAIAKCAPPLRAKQASRVLLSLLYYGAINFVASDHSPAPPDMKQSSNAFDNWGGISGCQTTLSSVLTAFFDLTDSALPLVARISARNVARRYHLPNKGSIEPGNDADLTLVDLNAQFALRGEDLLYRHKQSAFVGQRFHGVVRRTIVRGNTVFDRGSINRNFRGRLLKPTR